ncbi:uncharacterized protein LOC122258461 [Penaeus japonicus]|uniref:uncharacterized protein LOC122258461 n=1 Tax=Penaeus japonicus TaxID=27405 RepID=UPI001C70B2DE|nr:uncharacterized protein LOC122258461 [Penaeus japonicus]
MTSVVRRRVYGFGFACVLTALGQVAVYLFMLAVSVRQEYEDVQVASTSGIMAALTGVYAWLTGRLMFLLYERRHGEITCLEWVWWLCSIVVILFNLLLCVWFGLLSDTLPTTVSAVAASLYTLFFKFAKDDIKQMGIDEAAKSDKREYIE